MNTSSQKKSIPVPSLSFAKAMKEVGRNPYIDWVMVVFLAIFVGCILVLGGLFLFRTVSQAQAENSNAAVPDNSQIFDPQALSRLIQKYDARALLTTQAQKGYSGAADPSL